MAVEAELKQVKQIQKTAEHSAYQQRQHNAQQAEHSIYQHNHHGVQQFEPQLPQTGYHNPVYVQPSYAMPAAKQSTDSMESVLVKFVLPIVFIIVLLIGVLMLFVAGVAYGLITEPVRCLLGVLLAICMYVIGMLQHSYKRPIWGKALLGGAHGVFIITVSIAHLAYELIGVPIASLLYVIAFALIMISALRWKSQLLVAIAIISGYLCMLLIDVTSVHATLFMIIQLVFSISMLLLSMKLNYRYAYCFAYFLLHLSLLITYGVHEYASQKYLLAALIAQHLVVFIQFVKQKIIHAEHTVVQFIGSIVIISWAAHLYNNPGGTSWTYSAATLILAIMYACALLFFERALAIHSVEAGENEANEYEAIEHKTNEHKAIEQKSSGSVSLNKWLHSLTLRTEFSTIITAIALLCFFTELLGTSFLGLILLIIGISLLLFGVRDEYQIMRWTGVIVAAIGIFSIMLDWPSKFISYEMLSWIVMLASIPIVYRECRLTFENDQLRFTILPIILWTEAALLFIFFTIIGILTGEMISLDAQSYMVTAAWLMYAIGAIMIGSIKKIRQARLTGIILLLVIVVKLIFVDMTFLSILTKSIMFTVLGLIGIIISFILYNRTDENKR